MTDHYNTEFERIVKAEQSTIKVQDIPNARFEGQTFMIGDYVDTEHVRESRVNEIDDMDALVEWAFEPLETYLSGVPEITIERVDDPGMSWCDVTIELPDDTDRQALLAELFTDAWTQRIQR